MRFHFLLVATLLSAMAFGQSSVYGTQIERRIRPRSDMSVFKGFTIVVLVQSVNSCTKSFLKSFYDSLKSVKSDVALVVIPADDLDNANDSTQIKSTNVLDSDKLVILKTSGARKSKMKSRSNLVQWLTTSNQNSHFEIDVATAGNLYVINKSGEVTNALQRPVSFSILADAILHN